ncbi:hypothetical protein Q5424_17195 [Conexibacter sp. JD483]|uniref:hypothetical protein n=1 Tax=unclassified Conexibacter TaxID=2627773 RepID=UPI002721CE20|nr:MULTISPECIES: hypothetical protein [unclassified Conexibacter]MDO8188663.1 hypothetical protein [Conexibacter sp. CPCC 205706]MDO8199364.1 hypothetical protein [Conexibacter sp. CPCC 205762]MDR9370836.1 hypothetical protein [Conexibacter sp. JD483]
MSMRLSRHTRRAAGRLLAAVVVAFAASATAARADTLVSQPVLGAPATKITPFGAAPGEGPGSVWAYGQPLGQPVLVGGALLAPLGGRQPAVVLLHAGSDGIWQVVGAPAAADGSVLPGFRLAAGVGGTRALAAQMTSAGGGLLVGSDEDGVPMLLVRDPGGQFKAIPSPTVMPDDPDPLAQDSDAPTATTATTSTATTAATTPAETIPPAATTPTTTTATTPTATTATTATTPTTTTATTAAVPPGPATAMLQTGERLYAPSEDRLPAAPLDENGRTGVLLAPAAPAGTGDSAVLHWDGSEWRREPIELPTGVDDLRVVALASAGPGDSWLLASSARADGPLLLFRRDISAAIPRWVRVSDAASPLLSAPASVPAGVTIAPGERGQPLTATADGVWVDGTIAADGVRHDLTLFVRASTGTDATAVASWCDATGAGAALCTHPLGLDRTEPDYRSVAFAAGDGGIGGRIVSGYGDGQLLRLEGTSFELVLGAGLSQGTTGAIAFSSSSDGWVGGGRALARVTATPVAENVEAWPVPFRRPLLAIAPEPGKPVGAADAGALAVGDGGQVARYAPGSGWRPEFLLDGNDTRATPTLRAVAWPTPDLAFAVGDDGAMWRWRSVTGLWEPDPGKPLNFKEHLMGVAFDPANPDRGYAVGKNGTLLRYEKSWEADQPPAGLEQAQFSSLAFAGSQAIATYRVIDPTNPTRQVSGLVVNDGTGWRVDDQAAGMLAQASPNVPVVLRTVAGLPDGGAVAAGIGADAVVIERDGPGQPWRYSAQPLAQANDFAAVAAIREGDRVRAVVSVDSTGQARGNTTYRLGDLPAAPIPDGAPPFLVEPDPLPAIGFLLRETADGWRDEQHASFGLAPGDGPLRPDATLAMALSTSGDSGWVVGGEVGSVVSSAVRGASEAIQTAGVMRYPATGQAPPGTDSAPVTAPSGDTATFAIGGGAQCASLCARLANTAPGPDRWLPTALQRAAGIAGVRAFLYTGGRLAPQATSASAAQRSAELNRYAQLLGSAPSLPTFAAATAPDADASGSTASFRAAFTGFGAPFGTAAAAAGISSDPQLQSTDPARTYYTFDSADAAGRGGVRVFVLDYSATTLGTEQLCWLARGLGRAAADQVPAIVVGSRPLTPGLNGIAADATAVSALLAAGVTPDACPDVTAGRASAYFFLLSGENRAEQLTARGERIPAWGTGSLGYTALELTASFANFSASGFLLAVADFGPGGYSPSTNQVKISVRLIPNISELALDSTDGTLLQRSVPALFDALARRPRGGFKYAVPGETVPDPYVSIPSRCVTGDCARFIRPEYQFVSSRRDIGDFVKQDPASTDPHAVLLGSNDKPIADSSSGLFCPFNRGTTTVSVRAGGLVYSQQVTVQQGSVRRPCGTVPLEDPPPPEEPEPAVPEDPPEPTPDDGPGPTTPAGGSFPIDLPPPGPVPAVRASPTPPPTPKPTIPPFLPAAIIPPFLVQLPNNTFLPPVINPPAPPSARPSPPSGTSPVSGQVTQTAVAPEEKREEEVAVDMAHNMAAYEQPHRDLFPAYLAGIALLGAIAGVTIRRGRSRDGDTLALSVARADGPPMRKHRGR